MSCCHLPYISLLICLRIGASFNLVNHRRRLKNILKTESTVSRTVHYVSTVAMYGVHSCRLCTMYVNVKINTQLM